MTDHGSPPHRHPVTGGRDDLLDAVHRILAEAGFDRPARGTGLQLRRCGEGLLLDWLPGAVIGPTLRMHRDQADLKEITELDGIRRSMFMALTETLRAAGFEVAAYEGGLLLVTRRPAAEASPEPEPAGDGVRRTPHAV
ncbi:MULTISPECIES: hypothetical protein [unclassified Streptomyces]|uniref:hypothetical protein n=1 Tax=unclassified Streptomyces TaxID=2593676 RepID=UPI00341342C9